MADTKISGLTEGGTIQADDYLPAVRGGANVKVNMSAASIGFQLIGVNTTAKALDVLGHTAIGKGLVGAATTAAAQTLLEATPVGLGIFKAATTAAQQNLLEAGAAGLSIFKAATTAAAQNLLEATTPGLGLFKATTTAAQQNLLEAGTVGLTIFKCATTAAVQNIVERSTGPIRAPGITIDGGGSPPSTGSKGYVTIPYTGTIANWYMAADASGSAVIDVKRGGASIVGSGNKPTLSGDKAANASAASWTSNAIAAGDILEYNLDSATTITRVNLTLKVTVT